MDAPAISAAVGPAPAPTAPADERGYPLALTYASLACLLGVLFAPSLSPIWVAPAGGCLALGALRLRGPALATLALACTLAFALGAWRATATAYHDSPAQVAHYAGSPVIATGIVDGEAQTGASGENLPIAVQAITLNGRSLAVSGRILLHYTGAQSLEYGDQLWIRGQLQAPARIGGFDYPAYLAGQGIHATISFPTVRVLARGAGNPLQHLALAWRARLRTAIERLFPHDAAMLLIGILLGAPTRSLGTLTSAFVAVGMIHIVAISGLKVALVAGMIDAGCRGLPMRLRWLPAGAGVLVYTLLSGATPSGLRAALMWGLALLALQTGRRAYVWVSLALVAAGMALWSPLLLHDTGFQLSVVGTAGIVVLTPWCERLLRRLPALLREPTAVTLAAQIATLPITALGFGQLTLVGPLSNGLLLPLLGPIMIAGTAVSLLGTVSPWLAQPFAWLLYPLLACFIWVVRSLASLPFATLAWPAVPQAFVITYYLLLAAVGLLLSRAAPSAGLAFHLHALALGARARLLLPALLLVSLAVSVWSSVPPSRAGAWIAGTTGDPVVLLQSASGQYALIDGGQDPATVQALLGRHLPFWSRDLALVAVTQPDRTHIAGLAGLSALYTMHEIVDPGAIYPSAAYAHWRAELRDAGIHERKARTGAVLEDAGGLRIIVLSPYGLSLDAEPAPVAYLVRARGLSLLLLNRQAVDLDPTQWHPAIGSCLDTLVLPARADPDGAAAVIRTLRPHLLVVGAGTTLAPSPLATVQLPSGTTRWLPAAGSERELHRAC